MMPERHKRSEYAYFAVRKYILHKNNKINVKAYKKHRKKEKNLEGQQNKLNWRIFKIT